MPAFNSHMNIFVSIDAAKAITCPQAFLDVYKLVKTPATEEDAAAYYSEAADGLSVYDAMRMTDVSYLWSYDGTGKPVKPSDAVIGDNGEVVTAAVEATHIQFVMVNPTGILLMTFSGVFAAYAQATGKSLDANQAIKSRDDWNTFVLSK